MTEDPRPDLSIILPAYNAADFIAASVNGLLRFFEELEIKGEIVIVDDGSKDDTAVLIPNHPQVSCLRFDVNRGKGAAVREGMIAAKGKVRIFTDADLPYGTMPILQAYHLLTKYRFYAILGDRALPGSEYFHSEGTRKIISFMASFLFRTLIIGGVFDSQCGFKGFRGDVAEGIFKMAKLNRFVFDMEIIYLLFKHRLDVKSIPVKLSSHNPSNINVMRESFIAVKDLMLFFVNWQKGAYISKKLWEIWKKDMNTLTEQVLKKEKK